MSSVGRVDLDIGMNYGPFQQQLNGIAGTATNLVGGAFKSLGGIIAGAFAIHGLVEFGREAINLASDLQEVQNVVDVTFGSMAQDINNWSKTTLNSFGLSELSAKRYSSTLGAMMKSSGLAGVQMETMSKKLTELSADMASFYNLSTDEAFEKIRSGISGETEPLKQLGVNMSVANMEAYALSQGIKTSWEKMDQASQTLLRYNYLLSVTGDAQGDFARTSGSWANQVRLMGEQWNIFKGTMGAGFINILTPILKGLNWIIGKLQIAAAYFKAFTELIFGNAASSSSAPVTNALGDMGSAADNTAGSMDAAGKATDKAGKKTKKAAKDVKGSLASFDQLNTLTQSTADAAKDAAKGAAGLGGIGAGLGSMGDLDLSTPSIDVDPIKQQVADLMNSLKASFNSIWNFIKTGWAGMRPALQPFVDMMPPIKRSVESIGQTFKTLMNKVLVPMAKYVVGDFIPSIVVGFTKAFAPVIAKEIVWTFAEFDKTFKNSTNESIKLWNTVWLPSLEQVKNAFVSAMPQIASALDSLLTNTLNPFSDFIMNGFAIPIGTTLAETLVPIFTDTLVWAIQTFATTFTNAVNAINDVWTTTLFPALQQLRDTFMDVIPQIGKSIQSLLDNTIKPFVEYALNDFIIPIVNAVVKTLAPIFTDVLVLAFKEAAKTFKWAVDLINDIFKTTFKPVFDLIKQIVQDTLQIVKDLWTRYGADILSKISEMMNGIRGTFQKLWDEVLKPIIEPFLTTLKDLWQGTIKGIIQQVGELTTTSSLDLLLTTLLIYWHLLLLLDLRRF
ncbi:methyl-accepting chemotaxis protein [Paenibacillus shirakamiensis]|uniref:Methyl-accepting chemotaxis protein n=1 Tax=Paenibacillus shirakamiensis TaxID=1265935 RepID=A0ABS4JDH7_9BACL|nr:hypothetical protein [Paenibacillus shirakamiensis]MBP1999759.1 methyl-accepting chemotaxis protein [Paenibacillus shirakamiensis]